MVFPIMEMRRLSVGQDLANLNTLSWGGGDDGDGGGGGGDGDGRELQRLPAGVVALGWNTATGREKKISRGRK